jgi:hypothetical protein
MNLPDGHTVTYAEDVAGGWFADLRDADGALVETGVGATQDEAREHLSARLEARQ